MNEEAIERLNRYKTIKVLYGNTFAIHLEQLEQLQNDIETVLNLLEKKDKKIEHLEKLNKFQSKDIKEAVDYTFELNKELEKKEAIINEMANKLVEAHSWFYSEFDNFSKEDFIKYFTKKAEKGE